MGAGEDGREGGLEEGGWMVANKWEGTECGRVGW